MFQHEYAPGFWYQLAERLPFALAVVLVASALFAGFSGSLWGVVVCVANVVALLMHDPSRMTRSLKPGRFVSVSRSSRT